MSSVVEVCKYTGKETPTNKEKKRLNCATLNGLDVLNATLPHRADLRQLDRPWPPLVVIMAVVYTLHITSTLTFAVNWLGAQAVLGLQFW